MGDAQDGKAFHMKNLSDECRPLTILDCGPVPGAFDRLIAKAAEMGRLFAAAYCALPPDTIPAAQAEREARLSAMAEGHEAVRRALEGVFHFATTDINLVDKRGLDGAGHLAVLAAAKSQHGLMRAFLGLPKAACEELADGSSWYMDDEEAESWRGTWIGAFAAARVAHALCRSGAPCLCPSADLDVRRKIDLVCGPFEDGGGYCIQIKSATNETSVVVLTEKPVERRGDLALETLEGIWRGTAAFNADFGVRFTPVAVEVSLKNMSFFDVGGCQRTEDILRRRLTASSRRGS